VRGFSDDTSDVQAGPSKSLERELAEEEDSVEVVVRFDKHYRTRVWNGISSNKLESMVPNFFAPYKM
jgi:hypothetical protein